VKVTKKGIVANYVSTDYVITRIGAVISRWSSD